MEDLQVQPGQRVFVGGLERHPEWPAGLAAHLIINRVPHQSGIVGSRVEVHNERVAFAWTVNLDTGCTALYSASELILNNAPYVANLYQVDLSEKGVVRFDNEQEARRYATAKGLDVDCVTCVVMPDRQTLRIADDSPVALSGTAAQAVLSTLSHVDRQFILEMVALR